MDLFPAIRLTEPSANDEEALVLIEAYLKQDGSFDWLVRWASVDTSDPIPRPPHNGSLEFCRKTEIAKLFYPRLKMNSGSCHRVHWKTC